MKSGLKASPLPMADCARVVATYAAMKSGLKVCANSRLDASFPRSNLCRDEKRTESIRSSIWLFQLDGSNLCRDEKRTESSFG